MSLDRSLKAGSGIVRHRNVLSRAERIEKLQAKDKFSMEKGDPLGLPKVANRKVATGGKVKEKAGDAAAAEAGVVPAAAPAVSAAKADAKGAAKSAGKSAGKPAAKSAGKAKK